MSAFIAERATRTHSFVVERPVAKTFPLFTPEGERRWAEGWDPSYLHPADGHAQPDMVFTTRHGGEETIWMATRHEPAAGIVEYARVTPGSRAARVLVQCTALSPERTRVTVIYVLTGLTEAGNAYVRRMDEGAYRDYIDSWRDAIARLTLR
ncbi:MAG TPA: hypothetical protein VLT60_08540 [Usitatibacter sp.]|nr:hypothetical protein [Usitatibacter sp.]